YDTELSCMMIDIDHFKEINDNYGHQFGDTVLEELSQILKNNTREVDICGRYGGEEFLIISTQGEEGAKMHAEKIQKAVRAHRFSDEGDSPKVTVSIGIATMKGKVSTKQDLIAKADKALYQAKDEGRDLIRVWTEEKTNVIEAIDQSSIFELKEQFIGMSKKMKLTYIESTNALLKAVDTKDHYTYQHSKNVANCSEVLARELRLQDENVEIVKNAALLHDIGKIGIEKELLMKEEGLTDKEFEVIKNHPRLGVNILRGVNFLEKEIPIILSHHEWYDGNGYPEGLKGREIPFGAQIISVADAFDAMSTPRNYRKKLSIEKIMQELKEGAGTQFNSEIIEAFFVAYDKGLITTGNGMD
ncbi:MAG: diguanylate cyclase, partial [Chitinivibrionales bacterium]